MALTEKLTAIAQAIRAKTGKTAAMTLDEMVTEIGSITAGGGGGDNGLAEAILTDTLTELTGDFTTIAANALYKRQALKKADLPLLETAGDYAFAYCANMTAFSAPRMTLAGQYAFNGAGITELDLPELETANYGAFTGTPLVRVAMPRLYSVATALFRNCAQLQEARIPNVRIVSSSMFSGCRMLERLDVESPTMVSAQAFTNCESLTTLILRREDAFVPLGNINAFTGTPIAAGTGWIYVPGSLLDTYRGHSTWASYINQFRAIEDYPEVCQ